MSFTDLNLHSKILQAVNELGFDEPTPIQKLAIPHILAGSDVRACAQTGTGKTAAFILPSLTCLMSSQQKQGHGPRILVLVPTRELAMQVHSEVNKFTKHLPHLKSVCIYGGAPYPVQNRELSRKYEILVATPGRLIDHLDRGRINFSRLEFLILDEADRMLDMGFIDCVKDIAHATPKTRQTLMFSATLKGSVLALSKELMNKPVDIAVEAEKADHKNIEQRLHQIDDIHHKYQILDHLLKDPQMQQAIIFISTKIFADQLMDKLYDEGHAVAALHGDMSQQKRTRTMMQLRKGKIRILVATDVAARGIDVQSITHVINFDLPTNVEDYVHRIGRTGRAGASGIALSFASLKEMRYIKEIEKFTGETITPVVISGLEPKLKSSPSQPSRFKRNFRSNRPFNKRRSPNQRSYS